MKKKKKKVYLRSNNGSKKNFFWLIPTFDIQKEERLYTGNLWQRQWLKYILH